MDVNQNLIYNMLPLNCAQMAYFHDEMVKESKKSLEENKKIIQEAIDGLEITELKREKTEVESLNN